MTATSPTRRRVRAGLLAVSLLVALAGASLAWYLARDPLTELPAAAGAAALAEDVAVPLPGAVLRHIVLTDAAIGRIGFAIRLPDPLPDGPLPLLLVLGGLGTGVENIRHVPDAGPNAVVGYDWPVPFRLPDGSDLVRQAPALYHDMLTAPAQIAAGLHWLLAQPWADRERVSLLAFSLGALAAPAVQRLAARQGDRVGWTILAYGGAPIGEMVARHPAIPADWLRPLLGGLANLAFRPIEPSLHLPRLTGRFLVMGGASDRLVPQEAFERLRAATPEPKKVVILEGDHMGIGPGQLALLEKIIEISREWLIESGAVRIR